MIRPAKNTVFIWYDRYWNAIPRYRSRFELVGAPGAD
jgi:hypothetical protein